MPATPGPALVLGPDALAVVYLGRVQRYATAIPSAAEVSTWLARVAPP